MAQAQLPFSVFFNVKLFRGRAEGATAHLGPGCQEHGCHHLLPLSEKGWSFWNCQLQKTVLSKSRAASTPG